MCMYLCTTEVKTGHSAKPQLHTQALPLRTQHTLMLQQDVHVKFDEVRVTINSACSLPYAYLVDLIRYAMNGIHIHTLHRHA